MTQWETLFNGYEKIKMTDSTFQRGVCKRTAGVILDYYVSYGGRYTIINNV